MLHVLTLVFWTLGFLGLVVLILGALADLFRN